VSRSACRLLPYAVADGPHNMAADEVLLESAAGGVASLRFYGWSGPTVSLGYFQPHAARRDDPRRAALPYVRRPSGGLMLVHHHELTYALALPPGEQGHGGRRWLGLVHRAIASALAEQGVLSRPHEPPDRPAETPLCFRHLTAGDLLVAGHKVVGSAQRKQRGALMQHGGVLLAQSSCAPELPGLRELTGRDVVVEEACAAVAHWITSETGWGMCPDEWRREELSRTEVLAREKYARPEWNDRR